ncbi:MAG: hypothetical protein QF719_04790 [Chloroflexota bacterium]|nr:hypothetical protein [Chloroflexota bacterium]MDP6509043.1 hypothetical protein [Chloroflexota bacterium]MDP6757516.1 hypothetical protein [Chloroflexota bacterium]
MEETNAAIETAAWSSSRRPSAASAWLASLEKPVEFGVPPDPTETLYVNMGAERGGEPVWLMGNFPIFPETVGSSAYRQSADFDIALLGVEEGQDLTGIAFNWSITPGLREGPPTSDLVQAPVDDVPMPTCSDMDPGAPPAGGVGSPAGVMLEAPPDVVIQHAGVGSVQEGDKMCQPGSYSRSISWLNRQYNLGYT